MTRFETRKTDGTANSYEVRLAGYTSPLDSPVTVLARGLGQVEARFLCDHLNADPRPIPTLRDLVEAIDYAPGTLARTIHQQMRRATAPVAA